MKTSKHKRSKSDLNVETVKELASDNSQDSLPNFSELSPRYTILSKLGEGAFSKVYKALDNDLNVYVAIKIIDKSSMSSSQIDSVFKEISIMRRLDHPNVVKLYNYINTESYTMLMIEFISGGELFNQIVKYTYFSEELSRHIILQVVKAIDYLHSEVGVVHRDIKPENLLFEKIEFIPSLGGPRRRRSDDDTKIDEGLFRPDIGGASVGCIKLADFGLSKVLWDSNTKTPCGTASYTAPEIVKDEAYSKSVDMWAIGCVLYTLLCGFPPFYDTDPKTLTQKVAKGEYTFLSPWWDEVSKEAKDLVSHLLTVDPSQRYGTDDVLNHPWILNNDQPTNPAADAPVYKTKNESILRFEETIPSTQQYDHLSPRAEALKFAFDAGIGIQRTGTPLRRLLDEEEYFNESDEESETSDDDDDDDDEDDDNDDDDDDDTQDDSEEYAHQPIFGKSPIIKKFPRSKAPLTPTQPSPRRKVGEEKFKEIDGFKLNIDGNTLLNRRKMTGSLACGPP